MTFSAETFFKTDIPSVHKEASGEALDEQFMQAEALGAVALINVLENGELELTEQ